MSVEKVTRQSRRRLAGPMAGRARPRALEGSRHEARRRRVRRRGPEATAAPASSPPMDAGKETLAGFAEEWWRLYAVPNLAPKTLQVYADLWDRTSLPRLGGYPLRDLTPEVIAGFRADLGCGRRRSDYPEDPRRSFRAVLQRAVEWHRIDSNPARAVRKPPQRRCASSILPPRWQSRRCERSCGRTAACATRRSFACSPTPAFGPAKRSRSSGATSESGRSSSSRRSRSEASRRRRPRQTRTVRLLAPLASDLAEWRLASGRPDRSRSSSRVQGWSRGPTTRGGTGGRRVFAPAADAVGLDGSRPYDLRHAFCSLLLAEGASRRRDRPAGRSLSGDDARHLRARDRGARGSERRPAEAVIRRLARVTSQARASTR